MENMDITRALLLFTPDERREIKQFLTATCLFDPADRHHAPQILNLFTLLMEKIDRKKIAGLEKKHIQIEFAKRFSPQKGVAMSYLNNLMFELLKQVEKFIWVKTSGNDASYSLAAARFYQDRDFKPRAKRMLNEIPKLMEKLPPSVPELLLMPFWRNLEIHKREGLENKRKGDLNLPETMEALTIFYSSQILQLATLLLQQGRFVTRIGDEWKNFITDFQIILRRQKLAVPGIAVYELALRLLQSPSNDPESDLKTYQEAIRACKAQLPFVEVKNLAAYARNFCTEHIPPGPDDKRLRLQFEMFKEHLAEGWLSEKGNVHYSTLTNLVTIGLRMKEVGWVFERLQEYRDKVLGDEDGFVWHYCLANYYFYLQDFSKAKQFEAKHEDVEIEKIMRILKIKIEVEQILELKDLRAGTYYALKEDLEKRLKAFDAFVQRSQLTSKKRTNTKSFIFYVQKLINAQDPYNTPQKTREYLNKILVPSRLAAEMDWLKEKAQAVASSIRDADSRSK